MDPSKQQTYNFIEDFFKEISQVFPEKYLHLGAYIGECQEGNLRSKTSF